MITHRPKTKKNSNSTSTTAAKKTDGPKGVSLNDNRPEATVQRKLVGVIQRMPGGYGTFDTRGEDEIDRERLTALFDIDKDHDPSIHGAIQTGNQVTPEAFEGILSKYSAIRKGDTPFRFEEQTTPLATHAHKTMALRDIGKIMQTATGRELIDSLIGSNIPLDITKAKDSGKAFEKEHAAIGGYQNARERSLQVNYAPDQDILNRAGKRKIFPRGNQVKGTSDSVLYHELVHAHHVATNTRTAGKLAVTDNLAIPRDVNVNKEEYATVGLGDYVGGRFTENKYRAEQRLIQNDDDSRDKYARRTSYRRFRS